MGLGAGRCTAASLAFRLPYHFQLTIRL
jgi:hypothetical protein